MTGSESNQFRSALHGFNRYDVVGYIESLTTQHERALRELKKENAALREQLQAAEDARDALSSEAESLRADTEALQNQQQATQATCDSLTEELAALRESLETEAEDEQAPQKPSQTDEMELAAYRRAEAVERGAVARAGLLYDRMNEACRSLSERVQSSGNEVSLLYTELSDALSRMKDTLAELKLTLEQAPDMVAALHDEVARDD